MESSEKVTIKFLPDGIEATAPKGRMLFDVAASAGVKIDRHCGGAGVCGKCRVMVKDKDILGQITETEKNFFSSDEVEAGIRLSCCSAVQKSGTVYVVDRAASDGHRILEGFSGSISEWRPDSAGYGISVDIGTTTVVCCLYDLNEHKETDKISFLNPQVTFGDDVISRIAYSSSEQGALERIQKIITDDMNKAVGTLVHRNGIKRCAVTEIVIAANTVMEHLFVGVSPESIGRSPYAPAFSLYPPFKASQIGIEISENGTIKMLPNVAGYVGADIVAGVAALDIDASNEIRLLVDIGTNNEIVIGNAQALYCCATAAGPALEGARIQYGMRASVGAIEKVTLKDGQLCCETIGDVPPTGLCGSGLIDAVALLVNTGVINKGGRFEYPEKCTDTRFKDRLGRNKNGMVQLLLTDEENPVYLTQKDIREVQLAVSAVKVGVEVMLEKAGITTEEVSEVCLAGAFGNHINIESAVRVGLIPDVDSTKIRGVSNTSGLGASMALASVDFYERTKKTAEKMSYIELSSLSDFQDRFIKAMTF
ncbi:MAG: ASKHA domain-containing protein [Cloacibacillus sp.]